MLELESDTQGLLIPRLTTEERDQAFNKVGTPIGLVIFNTSVQAIQVLHQEALSTGKNTRFWATYRGRSSGERPANPMTGDLYYDTSLEQLEFFNGETWEILNSDEGPQLRDVALAIDTINEIYRDLLEDSASPGGAQNADGTPISFEQLNSIFDDVDANKLANYQAAISQATHLSNPPTTKQVQDIIKAVNSDSTPPTFTSASSAAIDENSGENQIVYTAQATDESQVIRFGIGTVGSDTFQINPTTGEVRLIPNPDYESQSQYTLEITATDLANNKVHSTFN